MKLILILLILTAGIGIAPDVQVSTKNNHHDSYHSMEFPYMIHKAMDDNRSFSPNQTVSSEPVLQTLMDKRSLSDLRLFIEL